MARPPGNTNLLSKCVYKNTKALGPGVRAPGDPSVHTWAADQCLVSLRLHTADFIHHNPSGCLWPTLESSEMQEVEEERWTWLPDQDLWAQVSGAYGQLRSLAMHKRGSFLRLDLSRSRCTAWAGM